MQLPYKLGKYTLLEKIAAGGVAEVYKAVFNTGEGVQKTVAIKRLLPAWGGSAQYQNMLIDEARALVYLQHQSIVQVLELGHFEGLPFLVMEFVNGIDCARLVRELIRDNTPLPAEHAIYIISRMLSALDFAHNSVDESGRCLKIVHRDISPSNILLSWNGEVKVTDFGVAKGLHRTTDTVTGQIKGKYAYMAPEQACGQPVDARVDLFACGIVLYELITAKRLFHADTDFELLKIVQSANLPVDVMRNLGPEMFSILLLSLACKPSSRYQNAKEMLNDLQHFAKSLDYESSSFELSMYLKDKFPYDSSVKCAELNDGAGENKIHTKILSVNKKFKYSSKIKYFFQSVCMLTIFSLLILMGPYAGPTSLEESNMDGGIAKGVLETPKPLRGGSIAIDSNPKGAFGKIIIGNNVKNILTPFTMSNIDIGDGIDCHVEIGFVGYENATYNFKLTPQKPAFVKMLELKRKTEATISVGAKPWGLVSVPGYLSKAETPVNGFKLKTGNYIIKVSHPPSGKVVSTQVSLAAGDAKRCIATFDSSAVMKCR